MYLVSAADTVCASTPLAPAEGLSSNLRPLLATHPPNPVPSSAPVCANASDQLCHRSVLLHCIVSIAESTNTSFPKHPLEVNSPSMNSFGKPDKFLDHLDLEHLFCDDVWQMCLVIC